MIPPAPGERDLRRLLAGMAPVLDPENYAFCLAPPGILPSGLRPLARVQEAEGETLVLSSAGAAAGGLVPAFLARHITLTVHSDLEAVGFLAVVATRLAALGVSCNPLAGIFHDHLFVPTHQADAAMTALRQLQAEASASVEAPVLYQVRIELDAAAAEEWCRWMREVHVPAVLATGCFESGTIGEELEPPPPAGRRVFVMQYRAGSLERLEEYQRRHAPALQQAHSVRYAGRFEASRSIRRLRWPLP